MTWATTLELGDRPLPGPDEAAEYLEAYQTAGSRRFSPSELLVARAAAVGLEDAVQIGLAVRRTSNGCGRRRRTVLLDR